MVTYPQYINNHRRTKKFRSSTPHFDGCPYKYGTCVRIAVVKPKKPNSAQRKIAKVRLSNDRLLIAYIPGFGHQLSKNSEVMVRGGRVPDLPGVHYHIIRGKKDLQTPEIQERHQRRSKFALKSLILRPIITRRGARKTERRKELKLGFIIDTEVLIQRIHRLDTNIHLINNQFISVTEIINVDPLILAVFYYYLRSNSLFEMKLGFLDNFLLEGHVYTFDNIFPYNLGHSPHVIARF